MQYDSLYTLHTYLLQVAANESLGKSLATVNLHLPIQLGNREIHTRSNNSYDNISQQ